MGVTSKKTLIYLLREDTHTFTQTVFQVEHPLGPVPRGSESAAYVSG